MPSDISADVAYIGGVWCEGVLYGIHVVLFMTVWIIFSTKSYMRGRHVSSAILLSFSSAMFIIATAHVALAVRALLEGFVYQSMTFEGGPPAFYRFNVFPERKALYLFNTFLGDSLLIWRVYIIWGRDWKVCVPSTLLLLGTIICGIKAIVANATSSAESVFTSDILSWVTSTFVLTIVTQITATFLIAYRIYSAWRFSLSGSAAKSRYMSLIWLVVESGAIYTSATLIQLITYLLKMNAGVIMEFMLAQLSAMVPILIIIRVGLRVAEDGTTTRGNDVVLTTFHATGPEGKHTTLTIGGSEGTGKKSTIITDDTDSHSRATHTESFTRTESRRLSSPPV